MDKSPDAFRTISEVAEAMRLPQHVLRFWETRFPQIRPLKRGGGRRYYRPEDIELLQQIKSLLYNEGFTIKGVQKLIKEQGARSLAGGQFVRPQLIEFEAEPAAATLPLRGLDQLDAETARAAPSAPTKAGPRESAAAQAAPGIGAQNLHALRAALESIAEGAKILAQARAI